MENNNITRDQPQPAQNPVKDPKDWKTGNEPMTGPQRSYLHTLASEAGEEVDDGMTKSDASEKIDELQHKTGRGLSAGQDGDQPA